MPKLIDPPGKLDESIANAIRTGTGGKAFEPGNLTAQEASDLRKALDTLFGTPAAPRVGPPPGTEEHALYVEWQKQMMARTGFTSGEAIEELDLRPEVLARGSKLYRRHCLHCHGVAGDGRGPTGAWVHPHPRDYRQGLFKFISSATNVPTGQTRKPRRADLVRVLHQGIDGTSMPAFGLLPEHELSYLASYVTHLSIRGEVEYNAMLTLLDKNDQGERNTPFEAFEGSREKEVPPLLDHVVGKTVATLIDWARSNNDAPIQPPAYVEPTGSAEDREKAMHDSIRNGYKLFIGPAACLSCHTDFGRQATYRYDAWGTLVQPRNLTAGNYRGGRRPVDLYYRLAGGIDPVKMPAIGNNLNVVRQVEDPRTKKMIDQVDTEATAKNHWDLINFVKAMPYPAMLPPDVRKAVYGASELRKIDR